MVCDLHTKAKEHHFFTGEVEMDIAQLSRDVPQLSKVFSIIDKIGEGECSFKYQSSLQTLGYVSSGLTMFLVADECQEIHTSDLDMSVYLV